MGTGLAAADRPASAWNGSGSDEGKLNSMRGPLLKDEDEERLQYAGPRVLSSDGS